MDVALIALRAAGFSWLEIARTLGVGHVRARARAIALGLPTGHISSGTLTGVAIVAGARPNPRWTRGRRWRDEDTPDRRRLHRA